MNNLIILTLCLMGGIILGLFFFGGLWWTLQKGLASKTPALWFMLSGPLRMVVTLVGFYYIGNGSWQRTLSCLLGFTIARFSGLRMSRKTGMANES